MFKATKKILSCILVATMVCSTYTTAVVNAVAATPYSFAPLFSIDTADRSAYRNTWVFTGSKELRPTNKQIGSVRSMIHQFEERVRWELPPGGGDPLPPGTERYVFAVTRDDLDVAKMNAEFSTLIAPYNSKAVAVWVGETDWKDDSDAAIATFKTNLNALIDKIINTTRESVPLIITPSSATDNPKIVKYITAINEIKTARTGLVVADVYSLKGNAQLFNADGTLNGKGQLAASNVVTNALGKGNLTVPQSKLSLEEYIENKVDTVPTVTNGAAGTVNVTVSTAGEKYRYSLDNANTTITVTGLNNTFAINNLKANTDYVLKVYAENGLVSTALKPVQFRSGSAATPVTDTKVPNPIPTAIATKLNSNTPIKWVFMGDSITHGSMHTYGYDCIPQGFEKSLLEIDKRKNDVVINTATTSSTAAIKRNNAQTIENSTTTPDTLARRLTDYRPDIVVIMLGTNDLDVGCAITDAEYVTAMNTIVKTAQDMGAGVILRTPNPTIHPNIRDMKDAARYVRELASQKNCLLVDHNQSFFDIVKEHPDYLTGSTYLLADSLHGSAKGHAVMLGDLTKALNLNTSIPSFAMGTTVDTTAKLPIVTTDTTIKIELSKMTYKSSIKEFTVSLTKGSTVISKKVQNLNDDVVFDNLTKDDTYSVTMTGEKYTISQTVQFPTYSIKVGTGDVSAPTQTPRPLPGTQDKLFYSGDNTGSTNFRIPSMVTTLNDTVITMADARVSHPLDSANNIDAAITRKENASANPSINGFDENKIFDKFYFDDFTNISTDRNNQTASFIDSAMLVDNLGEKGGKKGRVFTIMDAYTWGGGNQNQIGGPLVGDGFATIGGKKYLLLNDVKADNPKSKTFNDLNNRSKYHYVVDIYGAKDANGRYPIYNLVGTPNPYVAGTTAVDDTGLSLGTKTVYSLNGMYEVYNGNIPLMVVQQQRVYDTTTRSWQSADTFPEVKVPMNIFYKNSIFNTWVTSYIYMSYSDDDGKTWSDPVNLNGMIKNQQMTGIFVGPGRGITVQNGANKGRLVFPIYVTGGTVSDEKAVTIYSDDGGTTWKLGNLMNVNSSESSIVEMPDGSLKIFSRKNTVVRSASNSKPVQRTSTSYDGGVTWTEDTQKVEFTGNTIYSPHGGTMVSAINYSKPVLSRDGRTYPAILMSLPTSGSVTSSYAGRNNGYLHIGLIKPDATKYKIDFEYSYKLKDGAFEYSALTELADGKIASIYEPKVSSASIDFLTYGEYTIEQLRGQTLAQPTAVIELNSNNAVSSNSTVKAKLKFSYPVDGKVTNSLKFTSNGADIAMHYDGANAYGTEYYYSCTVPTITANTPYTINFTGTSNDYLLSGGADFTGTVEPLAGTAAALSHAITIAAATNGTVIVDRTTALSGDIVNVTATPIKGYRLKSLKHNTTDIIGNSFTMPDIDVTITAVFELIPKISIDNIVVPIETPQKFAVKTTELDFSVGYTSSIDWVINNVADPTAYFLADTAYTAKITLRATDGYIFANTVSINGQAATVAADHLSVTYSKIFEKTYAAGNEFISDMQEKSFSVGWGSLQKDNVDGGKITIGTTEYAKGIFAHASSSIVYDINPLEGFKTFKAYVGINKTGGNSSSVTFKVYLDSNAEPVWQSSKEMVLADAAQLCTVDVSTAHQIRLVAEAGANNGSDHSVWADAKFTNTALTPIVNKAALITAITNAETLHNGASEGTAIGEYIVGSKAAYLAAINVAKGIKDRVNATQDEVNNAVTTLATATATFELKKETIALMVGDVTGNGVVNLEDALVALKIATTTNTTPTGNKFTNGNVNNDAVINKADVESLLAYIVKGTPLIA